MAIRPVHSLVHILKLLEFLIYSAMVNLAILWICGFLKANPIDKCPQDDQINVFLK